MYLNALNCDKYATRGPFGSDSNVKNIIKCREGKSGEKKVFRQFKLNQDMEVLNWF